MSRIVVPFCYRAPHATPTSLETHLLSLSLRSNTEHLPELYLSSNHRPEKVQNMRECNKLTH